MKAPRAFLEEIIDYAGLFPPAALAMTAAAEAYGAHAHGSEAWMLGRFVVPAARLTELELAATPHLPEAGTGRSWRLSALFDSAQGADAAAIDRFNRVQVGRAVVDVVEAKAGSVAEIEAILAAPPRGVSVYVEVPLEPDPTPLLGELAMRGARAKARTGGLRPEAVPTPFQLARFLAACAARHLPFKATAGLHHAVRSEQPFGPEADAPRGRMHGFLNVFTAAALLRAGVVDQAGAEAVLREEDALAFAFTPEGLSFRGQRLEAASLREARRAFAIAFGCCSFVEPVAELRSLGAL